MQIAQLMRGEPFIGVYLSQKSAGFRPISFRGSQDRVVFLQAAQELLFPPVPLRPATTPPTPRRRFESGRKTILSDSDGIRCADGR